MKRPTVVLSALALAAAAGLLTAGPLSPPAGPVAGTYKTLAEIEPRTAINAASTPGDADSMYKITSNGSYYLTADVITIPGKMGIEIAADDVTLDLNGFRVGGYPGALQGIKATGLTRRNITIKHGSIWTMSGGGISLLGDDNQGAGCRVQDVSIRDCGGDGLNAARQALLERIDASNNAGAGITAGQGSTLTACTASGNGDNGISTGSGSTLTSCSAKDNTNSGFATDDGCAVADCSAMSNGGTGFSAGSATSLHGCAAQGNARKGYYGGYGTNFAQCTARDNTEGGIYAGVQAVVSGCTVHNNGAWGIMTSPACSITGCAVRENATNGIVAYAGCLVKDNTCVFNGQVDGANIYIMTSGNRVEGNLCASAGRGIQAAAGGNVIIRNTCTGNTLNWQIVPGNAVAPIAQASTNGGTILGNTYGGGLGSSDPNANFSF